MQQGDATTLRGLSGSDSVATSVHGSSLLKAKPGDQQCGFQLCKTTALNDALHKYVCCRTSVPQVLTEQSQHQQRRTSRLVHTCEQKGWVSAQVASKPRQSFQLRLHR